MTIQEFSSEFDILYDQVTSNNAAPLNEYEKSVFLTQAQDDLIKSYFIPYGNKQFAGIDSNEIRQADFFNLIKVYNFEDEDIWDSTFFNQSGSASVDINSISSDPLKKILIILNESVKVIRDNKEITLSVTPISYTKYKQLLLTPYPRPLRNEAWRINIQEENGKLIELLAGPADQIIKYSVRYIKRPRPIILTSIGEDGLTIDGQSGESECELDPIIHREILNRAVELAKAAYQGDLNSKLILGNNSSTNIGFVPQQSKE